MGSTLGKKATPAGRRQVRPLNRGHEALRASLQDTSCNLKKVIEQLPVFRDQQTWMRHFQELIHAEDLVQRKDTHADDQSKRSPRTELLLQIIYRKFQQLFPPLPKSMPRPKASYYERARDYWLQHPNQFQKIELEISELKRWVFEPGEEKQNEGLVGDLIGLLSDYGFTCSDISQALRRVQSIRCVGSPPKWNPAAVKAEALRRQTGQGWLEITRQVCPCGKKTHNPRCRDHIIWPRVKKLRRLLAKSRLPRPQGMPENELRVSPFSKAKKSTD